MSLLLLSPSLFFFYASAAHLHLHSFPTRRSSDSPSCREPLTRHQAHDPRRDSKASRTPSQSVEAVPFGPQLRPRSEEHTSELQSPDHLVCRLLLEKKKQQYLLMNSNKLTQL